MSYLPQPPRAWSRVQSIPYCSDPFVPNTIKYDVYVPRTNKTVPPGVADLQDQILYKANIISFFLTNRFLTIYQ